MENRQRNLLYWGVTILVIATITGGTIYFSNQTGPLDDFAKCLKDKGAIFYGAYWCPACNKQKSTFGRSAQYLPYTECSDLKTKNQNELCSTAGIKSYPTWEFDDGERVTGILSPAELSEKTGCVLPQ